LQEGKSTRDSRVSGHLRYFSWDREGSSLILVGDRGRILTILDNKAISHNSVTQQNLRGVASNPTDDTALIVGNAGTVLLFGEGRVRKINAPTFENLRAVSWNHDGREALIVGNRGVLLKYSEQTVELIDDGQANLRRIAWKPNSNQALICSNCFAEEFIPSPNLYRYDATTDSLTPLNEGRVDLIGTAWEPDAKSALVVGYDVVWHTGFVGQFDGERLSPIQFESKRTYPVAVSWHPTAHVAAIGTSITQPGVGAGSIVVWDGQSFKTLYRNDMFFFSALAWDPVGRRLAALASTSTRTFNC